MKKAKEIHLWLNKKFKTYYGTIDNKKLKTIYIGIATWIRPVEDLEDYSYTIAHLRKTIKNSVYQNINSQYFQTDHYIVDIDIKDNRIEFNKTSYLKIEITLFIKNKDSVLSSHIKTDMIRFINGILSSIEKSNYFEYSLNKKEKCLQL